MSRSKRKNAAESKSGPAMGLVAPPLAARGFRMDYARWVGFRGVCIGLRMGPAGFDPDLARRLEDAAARLETVDVSSRWAAESLVMGLEALADVLVEES